MTYSISTREQAVLHTSELRAGDSEVLSRTRRNAAFDSQILVVWYLGAEDTAVCVVAGLQVNDQVKNQYQPTYT